VSEIIGLDIGSHSVKIVGLRMTSKGPFITALGIKEIPRRKDEEETHTLIENLKALLREVPLKTRNVRLTVSGEGVNPIRITLPSMPNAELSQAIRWEIKDQVPFPIETARIDFHILDEFVEEGVKKLDLMVAACPSHLIDQTLSIAEGAGLRPSHLDIAPFALWNAFTLYDQSAQEKVVALIDLGSRKTGIHLFRNGRFQFSREVTPAGADITQAIVEGLSHGEDTDQLYEQAEEEKQATGIPQPIPFWMRPVLERLVAEISRSLDYYRSQFNVERVDRVLLTGGGAKLKNLATFFSTELHLPVENFNPLKKIPFDAKKIDSRLVDQEGSHFSVALGLALPVVKRIELLPSKEPLWSKARFRRLIPILIPLITLLGFSGIIWRMNGEVTTLRKELDGKKARVENLENLKTRLTLLKKEEDKMKQDLSLLPVATSGSIPYREILGEVRQVVPNNATLTLFTIQSKGKPFKKGAPPQKSQGEESGKDEQKELHLAGLAFGSDLHCLTALAQIIEGLEKSPFFKHARLMSADENKEYNQPGTEFEIVCDLNYNGQTKEKK
jgi:type IV pilus assembly protein PilM